MKEVHIVNAFTDNGVGGNPAGVVLDADNLSNVEKQALATQVSLSETSFVSSSKVADFKLEFFTPNRQIPHCGHATIATFGYLAQLGRISAEKTSKETIDGTREIIVKDKLVYMEQRAPMYTSLPHNGVRVQDVLVSLHITTDDLLDGHLPIVANTGVNCLIVALKDEATVADIKPDLPAIEAISEKLDLIEYYIFSTETQVAGRDADARMFAPLYGIPEESATGMAAGPLACYLYDYLNIKKERFIIEQGHLMPEPSPSELIADLSLQNGKIESLMVGGQAKLMRTVKV